MVRFDHPAMDLEPEYYSAIGEFIFRCAQLEYQMLEIIWFATAMGYKLGRVVTIGMDAKVIRAILSTITDSSAWIKSRRHIQEINSIVGWSREFSEHRNRIAHGSWQSADGTAKEARIHYMKDPENRVLPQRAESLDAAEINRMSSRLRDVNLRAQRLIVQLGGVSPPLLGKRVRRIRQKKNS